MPAAKPKEKQPMRNPQQRVLTCATLVTACVAWAVVAPSVPAFAVAVVAVVVMVFILSRLDETFSIRGTEIHHRTWLRSVTIDSANLTGLEHPDAESSVRELLMVDATGQSISVPLSRLNDGDEFAQALVALLDSTPNPSEPTRRDSDAGVDLEDVVDAAA